jgi:hypothetical protein
MRPKNIRENVPVIRGILIDPEARTIEEVWHNGNFKQIYEFIKASTFTGVNVDRRNCIYVDDEGLLNHPRYFFVWEGYAQPLANRGLILGFNEEGDTVSCTLDMDEVKRKVSFTELSVQGFTTKEEDNVEIMPGIKGFRISNTPVFGPPDKSDDDKR